VIDELPFLHRIIDAALVRTSMAHRAGFTITDSTRIVL
jgi:hypothetical protein